MKEKETIHYKAFGRIYSDHLAMANDASIQEVCYQHKPGISDKLLEI